MTLREVFSPPAKPLAQTLEGKALQAVWLHWSASSEGPGHGTVPLDPLPRRIPVRQHISLELAVGIYTVSSDSDWT